MPNIELFAQRIQTAFDMPKYWTEAFQSAQKREEIVQVQTLASKSYPSQLAHLREIADPL